MLEIVTPMEKNLGKSVFLLGNIFRSLCIFFGITNFSTRFFFLPLLFTLLDCYIRKPSVPVNKGKSSMRKVKIHNFSEIGDSWTNPNSSLMTYVTIKHTSRFNYKNHSKVKELFVTATKTE